MEAGRMQVENNQDGVEIGDTRKVRRTKETFTKMKQEVEMTKAPIANAFETSEADEELKPKVKKSKMKLYGQKEKHFKQENLQTQQERSRL